MVEKYVSCESGSFGVEQELSVVGRYVFFFFLGQYWILFIVQTGLSTHPYAANVSRYCQYFERVSWLYALHVKMLFLRVPVGWRISINMPVVTELLLHKDEPSGGTTRQRVSYDSARLARAVYISRDSSYQLRPSSQLYLDDPVLGSVLCHQCLVKIFKVLFDLGTYCLPKSNQIKNLELLQM